MTGPKGICYGVSGTTPNRQFVVTWEQATNVNDPGSVLTFSVILTETTNTIDFAYQTATSTDGDPGHELAGADTTVGIQSPVGGAELFVKQFCGKGSPSPGFLTSTPMVFRFTPIP